MRMGNRGSTKLKEGLVLGHYRVLRTVRREEHGGLADAINEDTREMVALKLSTTTLTEEDARPALAALAEKLATVRNPHLVPVRSHEAVGAWGFQVFSPMTAEVLSQAYESGERFTPSQCLRIADDVATGLEALHERGLCHGDISPDNVVIARQNRARLFGIGLFAALNPPEDRGTDTRPQPHFAPERLREGPSPLADLYSLGLVLYEMLTGRQAMSTVAGYKPGSRDSLVPRPPTSFTTVAPHLPRPLEGLTFSLLQANPADRCPSAADFRAQIRKLVANAKRRTTPRPAQQ